MLYAKKLKASYMTNQVKGKEVFEGMVVRLLIFVRFKSRLDFFILLVWSCAVCLAPSAFFFTLLGSTPFALVLLWTVLNLVELGD